MNWLDDKPWGTVKAQWRLRPGTTYLNHGSFGPPPLPVQAARRRWQERLDEQPMDFFFRELEGAMRLALEPLAAFLGTARENLVFCDNATYGMNVVAASMVLAPGDQVLLTDHEYGAVTRIWDRACRAAGAELVTVRLPQPLADVDQIVDTLRQAVSARTRLAVVSQISSATAVTFPIREIVAELHRVGIPVCVDGPHAIAQLDVNLDELGCDFYTASCHKWLSAPFGSGFLYVAPAWQSRIQPPILSWGRLLPARPQTWTEEFVWVGTRDPSACLAIPAALEFLQEIGWDRFRRRTHALAQRARELLLEFAPRPPLVPDDPRWYGTMAHVPLPDGDAKRLQFALWMEHGIEVPIVDWDGRRWIRVSCHLYNTAADLDKLRGALRAELSRE